MAAHKKDSRATRNIAVDDITHELVESHRQKNETKGETIKRLIGGK